MTSASLYHQKWLNLYLHPQGFHLAAHALPKAETGSFLHNHTPRMLWMTVAPNVQRLTVFTGYAAGKYLLAACPRPDEAVPPTMVLATDGLLRRIPETTTLYNLEKCSPTPVDFLPLMAESLRTLGAYKHELLRQCDRIVSPGRTWQSCTRSCFIDGEQSNRLSDRVPVSRLCAALDWLQENLVDRMYELGASADEVDTALEDYLKNRTYDDFGEHARFFLFYPLYGRQLVARSYQKARKKEAIQLP